MVRIAALAVSGLLALGLSEIVLQIADYPKSVSDHADFTDPDSVFGWKTRPGTSDLYVSDEYSHWLAFDADGFRVADGGPAPRDTETADVLVLGDSFIEGYSVALEDRLPERLEATLAASGCPASVRGYGVAGYSTVQQLLWLRENLARDAPREVVLAFYYNDVWYNDKPEYYGTSKPYSVLRGDTVTVEAPRAVVQRNPDDEHVEEGGLDRIKLYRLAERAAKNVGPLRNLAGALGLYEPTEPFTAGAGDLASLEEFRVYRTEPDSAVERAWHHTGLLLSSMDSLAAAHDARFTVAYVPMRPEVRGLSGDALSEVVQASGWRLEMVAERLDDICVERGLHCLSLVEPLRDARATLGPVYYDLDTHWNAAGHLAAAQAVAAALQADGAGICQ